MIDDPFAFALAPVRARRQFQALLLRADAEFVRCSYLTVSGREPTASEFSHSLKRLSGGVSRTAFLRELLAAGVAQHGSTRWLREALRHERPGRLQWWSAMARNAMDSFRRLWRRASPEFQDMLVREAIGVLDCVPARVGATVTRSQDSAIDPATASVAERVYRELSAAIAQRNP
jgi:hypothetical protein